MRQMGVHTHGCPLFENLIPNEVVTVYVPAPADQGFRISVDDDDKQFIQMLDASVAHAVQVRDRAVQRLARKRNISIDGTQSWNYDVLNGVWVRLR